MAERAARILICDDHNLYRDCLRGFFERWEEFDVIGEASDGAKAVEFCKKEAPDLVLMDVEMPGMSGIEAARRIIEHNPKIAVLMLTVSTDEDHLVDAIRSGVRGYVLKSVSARELREGINAALAGEAVLSSEATMLCLDLIKKGVVPERQCEGSRKALSLLTEQERQILHYIALGESNKEIGAHLYLGESTVKKRISSIMSKLGFENRVQAAVFAMHVGLAQ